MIKTKKITERIQQLLKTMNENAWQDRSDQWLKPEMLKDIAKEYPDESVIVRRAIAIAEMLKTMSSSDNSEAKYHYRITEGELIVGVIALGSLGLGKVFPNYITENEKSVSTISQRSEMALFGHDSVNYEELVRHGLKKIISECDEKIKSFAQHLIDTKHLIGVCEKVENNSSNLNKISAGLLYAAKDSDSANIKLAIENLHKRDNIENGKRDRIFSSEIKSFFEVLSGLKSKTGDTATKYEDMNYKEQYEVMKQVATMKDKVKDKMSIIQDKKDFYEAVKISCEGVIEYAQNYADLAEKNAEHEKNKDRQTELMEIARICRKVPKEKAETFHEALQSIYFVHLALHSSMNQLSLGRLDQVLKTYYKEEEKEKQLELFECFIIKCAERLILDANTFLKQDHVDYGTSLITTPVPLDQWAEANEFLQNIIIGGVTPEGKDAVNEMTYLILKAYQDTKLFTPTLNARVSKDHTTDQEQRYIKEIAKTLYITENGMPVIGNDEVLIDALHKYSDVPLNEARDYVIDGCWEPLLNGSCDWTFRLFNMLTALECALNGGAALSNNPYLLRGEKLSYKTHLFDNDNEFDFEKLKNALKEQIKFFTDQAVLSIYKLYLIDQAINPTPLYSALLKGCMNTGRDKTWGGSDYRLAGVISAGVPQTISTLAAIKKWVFCKGDKNPDNKFLISEVLDALRNDYKSENKAENERFATMKKMFRSASPKFGSNDPETNEISKWLLDTFYQSVQDSKKLGKEIFYNDLPKDKEKARQIISLRALAGYAGSSLKEEFYKDFKNFNITAGIGTFELFVLIGMGNAASADRLRGEPLARNFAPIAANQDFSVGHILSSFKDLGLDRFGGGVITDICVDKNTYPKEEKMKLAFFENIISHFLKHKGNMLTVTVANPIELQKIYDLCEEARSGDQKALDNLHKYNNVNVRVAGYQAPFITLPKPHQEKYVERSILSKN